MHKQIVPFNGRDNAVVVWDILELPNIFGNIAGDAMATMQMNMLAATPPHIFGTEVGLVRPLYLCGLVYYCIRDAEWRAASEMALNHVCA